MRNLDYLEEYRIKIYPFDGGDSFNGAFSLKLPGNSREDYFLRVIASNQGGWDHISVSYRERLPEYNEMHMVKKMFFEDEEAAFQLFQARAEHVSMHPNCLNACMHLWRPNREELLLPPKELVII